MVVCKGRADELTRLRMVHTLSLLLELLEIIFGSLTYGETTYQEEQPGWNADNS